MDEETKVMLSAGELAIATDRQVILTKRAVVEKASLLFSMQVPFINDCFTGLQNELPFYNTAPKISKGENYNGFPYVIMDYPALFGKDNIFAMRTMFWWGNFFSTTLHISGRYKIQLEERIKRKIGNQSDAFYISAGEEEWQHHFEENNFLPAEQYLIRKEKTDTAFMKVALRYDLQQWNEMPVLLKEGYGKIAALLI